MRNQNSLHKEIIARSSYYRTIDVVGCLPTEKAWEKDAQKKLELTSWIDGSEWGIGHNPDQRGDLT